MKKEEESQLPGGGTRGDEEREGIFAHHRDIKALLIDGNGVGGLSSELSHGDSSVGVSSLEEKESKRLRKTEHA